MPVGWIYLITARSAPFEISTHTRIHTFTHTHIYTYTHTHIYRYTHKHIHTYTHIHTFTYTHIYTYTHFHIHTYKKNKIREHSDWRPTLKNNVYRVEDHGVPHEK